ncbi:MAG: hypothetical protein KIT88_04585 [Phycisphaeraceae bacterium]|nr:hypothetical protein [Phycisphaeraceae bacterium]
MTSTDNLSFEHRRSIGRASVAQYSAQSEAPGAVATVAEAVFEASKASPRMGVYVLDREMRLTYATATAAEMMFRSGEADVVGRSLSSVMSPEYAAGFADRLGVDGMQVERLIWGGWQILSQCRFVNDHGEILRVCVVQRFGGLVPETWNGLKVMVAPVADFGPLDCLSDREIEMAALIGMGMTVKEIAEHVHRSAKTVENHRISIGRKLGISDRLQIALMAYNAGLKPEDSGLKRVRRVA